MTHPYDGIYGTMDRAAFEAAYVQIPPRQHRQADVLMEPLDGDPTQVMLYPANASVTVWPWRTYWQKRPITQESTP